MAVGISLSNFIQRSLTNTDYDIAVTGGGLGGLCFSILAAKQGYSVVLFEKETYPFHKVCGEYISMESFPFLQKIGFNADEYNVPFVNELNVSDAKGKVYQFRLDMGGFGISRYTLDNALYKIAVESGVTVCQQTKINNISFENGFHEVQTNAKNYTAKVAIGSFGKRSNIDIKWKRDFILHKSTRLNNYVGIKYHVRYPHPENMIALHNFKDGYCGISSVENDVCCLCYLTTSANLVKSNNSIREMEKNILCSNQQLNKIFSEAEFLYKEPLAISQVSFQKKEQVKDHVLLLGDAAGLITPLCGNGMSMAMHAAGICFEKVHLFLAGKIDRLQMEQQYILQWKKTFGSRLAAGRLIQKLMGSTTSTSMFLQLMSRLPLLSKFVICSTHGKAF